MDGCFRCERVVAPASEKGQWGGSRRVVTHLFLACHPQAARGSLTAWPHIMLVLSWGLLGSNVASVTGDQLRSFQVADSQVLW